jgi:preprotein translocase subunit SecE
VTASSAGPQRPRSLVLSGRSESEDSGQGFPGEFIRQIRAEASKVVWPTRRETLMTAVMVLIMTTLLAIFFLGIDSVFSTIVKWLLSLLA